MGICFSSQNSYKHPVCTEPLQRRITPFIIFHVQYKQREEIVAIGLEKIKTIDDLILLLLDKWFNVYLQRPEYCVYYTLYKKNKPNLEIRNCYDIKPNDRLVLKRSNESRIR